MTCPRSPPDFLASCTGDKISQQDWLVQGMCAYVPQVSFRAIQPDVAVQLCRSRGCETRPSNRIFYSIFHTIRKDTRKLLRSANSSEIYCYISKISYSGLCTGRRSQNFGRWRRNRNRGAWGSLSASSCSVFFDAFPPTKVTLSGGQRVRGGHMTNVEFRRSRRSSNIHFSVAGSGNL